MHSELGAKIVVHLVNGSKVEGWFYGHSRLGFYIAIDRSANDIRFIPEGGFHLIQYSYDDVIDVKSTVYSFHDRKNSQELYDTLNGEILQCLERIDYKRVRSLSNGLLPIMNKFGGSLDLLELRENEVFKGQYAQSGTVEILFDVRSSFLQLHDELNQSGLLSIVTENTEKFRNRHLPYVDWSYFEGFHQKLLLEDMVFLAQHETTAITTDGGKHDLEAVPIDKAVKILLNDEPDISKRNAHKLRQQPKSEWPRRLRTIAALGKMTVGSGLATFNVGLGFFAGLPAAIPTLGLSAVGGAIGVGTSLYTGLNAACEGIKDLASAVESK